MLCFTDTGLTRQVMSNACAYPPAYHYCWLKTHFRWLSMSDLTSMKAFQNTSAHQIDLLSTDRPTQRHVDSSLSPLHSSAFCWKGHHHKDLGAPDPPPHFPLQFPKSFEALRRLWKPQLDICENHVCNPIVFPIKVPTTRLDYAVLSLQELWFYCEQCTQCPSKWGEVESICVWARGKVPVM